MIDNAYYLGLDLGQKKSYTAIAVVERTADREERRCPMTWALEWHDLSPPRVAVRHLERIGLGTSYVDVVDRVRELVWSDALRGRTKLVVDATGAGAPVVDLFRKDEELKRACELLAVTITSGTAMRRGPKKGDWQVPKQDLMTGLVLMLEAGKLGIARGMEEAGRLVEELVRYGREEGFRDDLALALALACWKVRADYPADVSGGDGGDDEYKSFRAARKREEADEFVGAIMGVSVKNFRRR